MRRRPLQSILKNVDQLKVSADARIETRSREVHLPPVSTYRWWARRTETVSGALVDAAAASRPGQRLLVADPFAGGGVIPLAVLKRGHALYAQDLNPWVAKGLATMLSPPAEERLSEAGGELLRRLDRLGAEAYATKFSDGAPAQIAHSLRVATSTCAGCGLGHRHFPHALVSLLARKDTGCTDAFVACPAGHTFVGPADRPSSCHHCGKAVDPSANYLTRRVATCPRCGTSEELGARFADGGLRWELVLVERSDGRRREIAAATAAEAAQAADIRWTPMRRLGPIPGAPETRVLHRHGFFAWEDLYPRRQRHVLEETMRQIESCSTDAEVRAALTMAAVGTAEMAGHLSRWDRFYLKSYESMSSHRFNFTTLAAEPNVIGGMVHGRGSMARRIESFRLAAAWCRRNNVGGGKLRTSASADRRLRAAASFTTTVVRGSSERTLLPTSSVDLVLTDPPYHDDVQYHELSLPFRAWAGLDLDRGEGEAVAMPDGNGDGTGHRDTLGRIFSEIGRILKPDGRLVFTYANRDPTAWIALFSALRSAGFRPIGYTILHGEDETGFGKRGARSCNLDMILELAPSGDHPIEQWRPTPVFGTEEEAYLTIAGDAFLSCSTLETAWETDLTRLLKEQPFLKRPRGSGDADPSRVGIDVTAPPSGTAHIHA